MDPDKRRRSCFVNAQVAKLLPAVFLALALLIPVTRSFLQEKPPPSGRFPPAESSEAACTGTEEGIQGCTATEQDSQDYIETEESSQSVPETAAPSSSSSLPSPAETAHVHSWQPVYGAVHHEAVTHTVHHEAVTHTVHHEAVTHVVRHEAETHVVRHEAETHVVHHEEEGHLELYERHSICNLCGLDLSVEYFEGRIPEIGIHSLDAHGGAAGWHSEWIAVDQFHPGAGSDARREDWITDVPAWDETVTDREAWDETVTDKEAWVETVTDLAAWDETVTDREAYDETVVDREAYDESVITGYRCSGCGALRAP